MKGPDVGKANHAPPPFSIRMGRAGGGGGSGRGDSGPMASEE